MKLFTNINGWQVFIGWIILLLKLSVSNAQCPQASFTLPDTVCIGENVNIINTSTGATRYEWDFCSGDLNKEPKVTSLLQATGSNIPTNITTVFDGTSWFGFFFSRDNNTLFRLDFGSSLDNTPTLINIGIFDTPINKPEPIEFVKEGNNWYAFTSNFSLPSNATTSHLLRMDFGPSLTTIPTIVDLGNPDNSFLVIRSIRIILDNGNYVGVLTNTGSSTVAIINFGNSITNSINQANILVTPVFPGTNDRLISTSVIKECNNWYGITTSETNGKIYRLAFGTKLFSLPKIEELSTTISLSAPTLSVLIQDQNYFAFISSELGNIYALDFGSSMTNVPIIENLGSFSILSNSYGFTLIKSNSEYIGFSLGYLNQQIAKIKFPEECSVVHGAISTQPISSVSYQKAGIQQISLKAYNNAGDVTIFTDSIFVRPVIEQSFLVNNQCINQPVTFTYSDITSGNKAISYTWDFGDGKTATGNSVQHTYTTTNTYNVTLSIKDLCNKTSTTTKSIKISQPSVANFSVPVILCTNQSLQFIDASTVIDDPIQKWEWEFSDKEISNQQNPVHVFKEAGIQSVSLKITGLSGCQTQIVKSITLKEGANVAFSVSQACLGYSTQFIDESTLGSNTTLVSRSWDFGDNQTSTTQNPSHTYKQTGTYLVKLTIENNIGCNITLTKSVTIHLLPKTAFSAALGCAGEETQFTDETIANEGSISEWQWDFGDTDSETNISTDPNPTHAFRLPGTYQVKLKTITTFGCTDSLIKSIIIIASPIANFTAQSNCNNREVLFTDTSQPPSGGSITNWYWDFGDNSIPSTEKTPKHTYTQTGSYLVKFTVTSSSRCTNTLTKMVVAGGLAVNFSPDTSVCANTSVVFNPEIISLSDTVTSWKWNFGTLGELTTKNPIVEIPQTLTDLNVSLTVTTASGCTNTSSKKLPVLISANAAFTYTTATSNILELNFINQSSNATRFIWDFGDNTQTIDNNPVHTYSQPGIYEVILRAIHQNGCETVMSKRIPLSISNVNTLTVFPNPVINSSLLNINIAFTLATKQSVQMELYDMAGRIIQQSTLNNTQLDFNAFTLSEVFPTISTTGKGLYLLTLRYGNTIQTQKIIVQ